MSSLSRHADAHRPGRAGNLTLGRLEIVGIEVGHLDLGDLPELSVGDRAHGFLAWRRGAFLGAGCLSQQHGGRRRLEDERERSVLEDRDLDGPRWASVAALYCLQNSIVWTP